MTTTLDRRSELSDSSPRRRLPAQTERWLPPLVALRRVAATLLLLAAAAAGQTNDDIFAGLQFSFQPPGARSMGMGGAFVGLGDDATAAYSNPAGLLWLREKEVSIEARQSSFTNVYLSGGRLLGDPTYHWIDVTEGLGEGDSTSDVTSLGFLSLAVPGKSGRWAVAAYRHMLADFEAGMASQGTFRAVECDARLISNHDRRGRGVCLGASPGDLATDRTGAGQGNLALEVVNWGVSGAARLTNRLWAGLGVSYYEFDISTKTERFDSLAMLDIFAPATYDEEFLVLTRTAEGSDSGFGFNAGLLWVGDSWSAGTVYRRAADFTFDTKFTFGEFGLATVGDPSNEAALSGPASFEMPHVLAVGAAVRPLEALTVSFEFDQVEYSRLSPEKNVLSLSDTAEEFVVPDGQEYHLGLEYVFVRDNPIQARLGMWLEPDHQMRFVGPSPLEGDIRPHQFSAGEDEMHYAAGLGFAFRSSRIRVDLAGDYSARGSFFTASSVFQF